MRRLALLFALSLAACTSGATTDGGVDLGSGALCLGGGFPVCTNRDDVPVCDPGACAFCAADGRVLCGTETPFTVPDLGTRTRCVGDPSASPPATCVSVCSLDPSACSDAGAD